jgi:hypothetical protein
MKLGTRVMLKNGKVGTVIYIVPPDTWPHDRWNKMEDGAIKFITPPKHNRPQLLMPSAGYWKKWRNPMVIVAGEPDDILWVSICYRSLIENLTELPEEEYQNIVHPKKVRVYRPKKIKVIP